MSRPLPAPATPSRPTTTLARLISPQAVLGIFGVLVVGGIGMTVASESWTWVMPPVLLIGALLLVRADLQPVLLLLLAVLPFSRQMDLPGGLSIDLPSEPLMLLMLLLVLIGVLRGRLTDMAWLRHPITLIIVLQLLWAVYSALFSVDGVHSLKFVLAKLWYLASFYIAVGLVVRRPADVDKIVWAFLPSLLFTIVWATARHFSKSLTLGAVGWAIQPFYLNHVIYAATIAHFLPFTLMGPALTGTGQPGAGRVLWRLALALLLLGIALAYTRATWLAVVAAGAYYVAIRWRLMRPLLIGTAIAVVSGVTWLVIDQNYVRFQPDYEHTVWHGNDLGAHLASTVEMNDASEMERVYRWVAAARMVAKRPLVGSGPSTFYPEYKKYTDRRFRTYVSDNSERSTTHNYFLLQLVEQGVPGLLLFCALVWWGLVLPQTLYRRTSNPRIRAVVLAAGLSLCITICHLSLNELVEVDKIGSFFFISLVLLVRAESWIREEESLAAATPQESPA